MSTARKGGPARRAGRPVGRDVYWRRRLLVLAAVFALAWAGMQARGLMRDDAPAATTPPPSATATSAPTPVAPLDQITVALDTSSRECDATNLRIVPSVPGGQASGGPIAIDLMLTTLDGAACTYQPDADDLLAVVDADGAPVYDTSVCRAAFIEEPIAVPAGWGTVTRVQWSGRGSGQRCGAKEGFAPAGTYRLQIGTYGGEPGAVTFSLAKAAATPAPAEPTTTSGASPKTQASPKPTASPAAD